MAGEVTPLRKRIVKALPFTLDVADDGKVNFLLSYDFNAAAAFQEKTVSKQHPEGLKLQELSTWKHVTEPIAISALFWAGIILRHPEYNSDQGLEIIRSNMDEAELDAIIKACWDAYLLNVPKEKREFMEELKKNAEAGIKKPNPQSPAAQEPPPETTSNSTGSSSAPLPDTTSELTKTSSAS